MKYALMFTALLTFANGASAKEFEFYEKIYVQQNQIADLSLFADRGHEWKESDASGIYASGEVSSIVRSSCKCGRRHYK